MPVVSPPVESGFQLSPAVDWEGWFDAKGKLVSTDASYSFTMPAGAVSLTPRVREAAESEMSITTDAHDFQLKLSEVAGLTAERAIALAGATATNAHGEALTLTADISAVKGTPGSYVVTFTTPGGTSFSVTVTVVDDSADQEDEKGDEKKDADQKDDERGDDQKDVDVNCPGDHVSTDDETRNTIAANDFHLSVAEVSEILAAADGDARLIARADAHAWNEDTLQPLPVDVADRGGLAAQAGSYPITFHANPSVTVTATVHDRVVSNPETGTTIWANDPTVPRDLVDALLAGESGALERFVEQAGIVAYDAEGNPVPIVRADLSQLRSEPGTYEVTLYTADGTAITVLVTVGVQQDGTVHQAVATLPKAPDTKAPDATESSAKSLPKTDDESPRSRSIAGMLAAALLSLVAGLVLRRKEQEEEKQCSAHRASNSAP